MTFNICQWTAERIAILRRLWPTGMPASKIAKQMGGVTRNGVIGKAHRLGIAENHYDEGKPKMRRNSRKAKPMVPPVALLVVEPILELPPEPPSPTECTIMELRASSCRWISGEVGPDTRYCGAQIWSGSYCRKHSAVAWKSAGK